MTRREHLLTILGEEAGEVIKETAKALRFGEGEVLRDMIHNPDRLSNRQRIVREFFDLLAIAKMLGIYEPADDWRITAKIARVEDYLQYSHALGKLEDA